MTTEDKPLTPEEEAGLDTLLVEFLNREEGGVRLPGDEAIYAYLTGAGTPDQKREVQEALMRSEDFCRELLEIARDLERLQSVEQPFDFRRVLKFAVPVAVAAAVLLAVLLRPELRRIPFDRTPTDKHLVVLPFENVGGDPVNQAFCDGLGETMTSKLSHLERFYRAFWVVPAGTVSDKNISSPIEAERAFGVTLAVTGSLQRLADNFRLTLNLINVDSSPPRQLSSTEIAGHMANVSVLQVAAVRKVAEMLNIRLDPEAQQALTAGDTDVPEAYRFYLQGRGYLQRYENVENLESAVGAFERAIEQDSLYALAYAGLGEAYWRKYGALKDTEWVRRAAKESERALELNNALAPIHVTLGHVRNEAGEYEDAISAFRRALELDSTSAGAYGGLADAYADLGRFEEAESTYQRAIEMKPDYWGGYNDLGYFYYSNGRFEQAVGQYVKVTELTPDNYLGFNNLGAMYYYLESWDEAKRTFRRSIEVQPSDRAYLNLGSIYYIEGRYAEAAEMCEKALEINETNYKTWATLANAYYWIPGRRNEALDAYRRAIGLAEKRLELNPRDARVLVTLAGYYVMIDENEKARSLTEQALTIASNKPFVVYFAGYVYEQLGEREKALEWIGKALDGGYPLQEIERDPWLTDLRADERFKQLVQERE